MEVKDNHGKLSFYPHFRYQEDRHDHKTDMSNYWIMMHSREEVDSGFDPARVKDLGWDVEDQEHEFDPSHVGDPPGEKQRIHPMQLRHKTVNKVDINLIDFSEPGDDDIISTKL